MKKIISIAAIAASLCITSSADVFILEKTNGEILEFNVETIKEMRFKAADEETGNLAPESVEIIDLGLSVCWASHNIGSTSTSDAGDYVMWGTTKASSWYSWSYYPFGNAQSLSKYTVTDGFVYLQPTDDIASTEWGTDWRMPTQEEANELLANCDIEEWEIDGHPGVKLTSKVPGYEGKYVFFPANGYIQDDYNISPNDVYLWTNTVGRGFYTVAMSLSFKLEGNYAGDSRCTGMFRYLGQGVRPVYTKDITREDPISDGSTIDLGLSVNWAAYNAGAEKPHETGTYVAWGETAPKDAYNWGNYTHGTGPTDISKYGRSDKITTLEVSDDAVTAIMGNEWRMPTHDELSELIQNCTVTTDYVEGVNGFRFTSKVKGYEDKSIFIPVSGEVKEDVTLNPEAYLYLWTSTLSGTSLMNQGRAYGIEISVLNGTPSISTSERCYGRPVRGVKAK